MLNIQRFDREPRVPAGAALREALVLGPAQQAPAICAGFARLGIVARLLDYDDAALHARVLGTRPDLVIVEATSPATERAARAAVEMALDGLRALAVPLLAAVAATADPAGELLHLVDDILLPPHDAAEAVLRATLVTRRRGDAAAHLVTAGPLTVDVEGFRAWLTGAPITLTYTEFQLLRLLLLNRGKVLTRQLLLNKIWGYDYLGGLRTVDVHIRRLRAKIEGEAPDLVETVRHVGYRIRE